MKISFNTAKNSLAELDPNHGFGNAAINMINTLKSIGHQVEFNDPTAQVGLVFNHPSRAQFFPNQYNILYFPWESTGVHRGWKEVMDGVDELWTPSPWCAGVFSTITTTPVYVYEHGIDHKWRAAKRGQRDTIKFFHQGAEAARKNGWDVVTAFRRAFTKNENVELTLKYYNKKMIEMPRSLGRVNYINEDWPLEKLISEYHRHDVYVYPSSGEGFGLTPLQAMASGMPTITVKEWAPYADMLSPELTLSGTLVPSTWSKIHPGKIYRINFDELVDRMRYAYDNIEPLAQEAYELAPQVHRRYDWTTLTREAFSALEERINY